MRSRFVGSVGLAIALLVVAAACGGSEGAPGGEKQAYINLVDPACEKAIQAASALGSGTDVATLEKSAAIWTALWQTARSRPVPDEDFDLGTRFLVGLNNISLAGDFAYQSAIVNNTANLQKALSQQAESRKTTGEAAKDYGFKECSQLAK